MIDLTFFAVRTLQCITLQSSSLLHCLPQSQDMPIDKDFPGKYHILGKYRQADSKNYHLVWVPGNETEQCPNHYFSSEFYKKEVLFTKK